MTRSSVLRTGILTAALSGTWLLGCGTHMISANEARAAIVGIDERRLLSHLGPPDDFAFAGEQRYFLYRLDLRHRVSSFGPEDSHRLAFCNLLFRIDRGVVTDVRVRGVTFSGLRTNTKCMMIASNALGAVEYAAPPRTAKAPTPSAEPRAVESLLPRLEAHQPPGG